MSEEEESGKKFTISLNRCTVTTEMKHPLKYPAQQEFEHLKRFRALVLHRINYQKNLIKKIKRGKWKLGTHPNEKILALAKLDVKLLQQAQVEFEERTSELRRKIHEETLNGNRDNPEDSDSS